MTAYHLAEVNIAIPKEPLDSALLADFLAAVEPINALADTSPGFAWRLQGDGDDATSLRGFDDDRIIINMSTWESLDALADFVYRSAHAAVMRERRKWFVSMREAFLVLWWVPAGHHPTVHEAEERLACLRLHGPTPFAFTIKQPFPPPDVASVDARHDACAAP